MTCYTSPLIRIALYLVFVDHQSICFQPFNELGHDPFLLYGLHAFIHPSIHIFIKQTELLFFFFVHFDGVYLFCLVIYLLFFFSSMYFPRVRQCVPTTTKQTMALRTIQLTIIVCISNEHTHSNLFICSLAYRLIHSNVFVYTSKSIFIICKSHIVLKK